MTRHTRLAGLLVAGLVFSTVSMHAQSPRAAGRGRSAPARDGQTVSAQVQVAFSTRDVTLIRQHYASRVAGLPPGLQKKLARTGQLPPGWQRKMEPFPAELERQLPRLPEGYARGIFEGNAVIYLPGTSVVIDASVLF